MLKLTTAVILACCLSPVVVRAAPDVADYACVEAMSETLMPGAPKALKATVLKACKAAFADVTHKQSNSRACDIQADKLPAVDRFAASYTCTTAMMIAYD